jgi:hypothetical protein
MTTRMIAAATVVLVVLVGGCSAGQEASPYPPPPTEQPSASPPIARSSSESSRRPLPWGFPVLPGAVAVELPADDPGLIGLWETDQLGSAAYDFYADALPAAGYPILGLYPGGGVALIRFTAGAEIWQMVAHGTADGQVVIEIRLDRP